MTIPLLLPFLIIQMLQPPVTTEPIKNDTSKVGIKNISSKMEAPKLSKTLIFYTNLDLATDNLSNDDDDNDSENYDDDLTTNMAFQDENVNVVKPTPADLEINENFTKATESVFEDTSEPVVDVENNISHQVSILTDNNANVNFNSTEETSEPPVIEKDEINHPMSNLTADNVNNTSVKNKTRLVDISGNLQIKIKENFDKIKNSLSTTDKHFHQSILQKLFTYWDLKPSFSGSFQIQRPPLGYQRPIWYPIKDRFDSLVAQYNFEINDGYFGQFTPLPPPFLWSKFKEKKHEFLNHLGFGQNYDYPYPYRSLRLGNNTLGKKFSLGNASHLAVSNEGKYLRLT